MTTKNLRNAIVGLASEILMVEDSKFRIQFSRSGDTYTCICVREEEGHPMYGSSKLIVEGNKGIVRADGEKQELPKDEALKIFCRTFWSDEEEDLFMILHNNNEVKSFEVSFGGGRTVLSLDI